MSLSIDGIDYAGDKMTVVESDARNIIVAPAGQVYIVDESQAVQEEVDRQMEDALYELKQEVDDIDAITKEEVREIEAKGGYDSRRIAGVMNDYFDKSSIHSSWLCTWICPHSASQSVCSGVEEKRM